MARLDDDHYAVFDAAENASENGTEKERGIAGALTLMRGLDVLGRVAKGDNSLPKISKSLGLNKSTVHRLASTLVDYGFLSFTQREGYALGTRLLELGHAASQQITLTRVAHEHLVRLAADTGDTVNLGVLDGNQVHYIDKIPGTRRIEVRCVIGERQYLRPTGLGKALLLDADEEKLREVYNREGREFPNYRYDLKGWLDVMKAYREGGYALDMDENEDRIRCVSAPIRDLTGKIVAAISISSAAQYMDDARLETLKGYVKEVTAQISRELGYAG
ncbi:MAG: IclR family transcriptional regulator [Asticcacaulis sp.]